MGTNRKPLTVDEVVDAAIICMARFGVAKTGIVDVAAALKVSRQTVHRLFESRADLLKAVAERRLKELGRQLEAAFERFNSLEEGLVEGSLLSLEVGRSDPIFNDIRQRGDHAVDQYMFTGSPSVHEMMQRIWGPLIHRARRNGELRPGLSDDQVVEWIRNVHAMSAMRDDYDDARKVEMFRTFLVPSLLVTGRGDEETDTESDQREAPVSPATTAQVKP